MDLAEARGLLEAAFTASRSSTRDQLKAGLDAVTRLRSCLAALEAEYVARLTETDSFPEEAIAQATRGGLVSATRLMERARLLADVPVLAAALADGRVVVGHVDAFGRVLRGLEPDRRPLLLAMAGELVAAAVDASVDEFSKHLRVEARRLSIDDEMERLERQRRDTRLRTWVDRNGMGCLAGRFDPATFARLSAKLDSAVAALFAEQTPPTCPTDPIEKQHHLRALALVALLNGAQGGAGRAEFVAVIDTSASPDGPVVDWGIPVEVPARVLAEWFDTADAHAVVIRNGVVLYAPGELNLGRTTRVASKAQRRALRALYSCCGIPGCAVRYDRCKVHHLVWWRNGGSTDLDNLLPLCVRHHERVHRHGWVITIDSNRRLTLKTPDGAIRTTGPPKRKAA
jgi:hypothetical protein